MTTAISERHIIDTAEILRSISPSRLGSIYYLNKNSIDTQTEIAEQLNCTPPTISQHMQKLASLPLEVVQKDGAQHILTPFGSKILNIYETVLSTIDISISNLDWTSETGWTTVKDGLYPLHTARGSMIFILLDALGRQFSLGNEINLFKQESPIYISNIVAEIQSMDFSIETSDRRIKRQLRKLREAECLEYDTKTIDVEKKGVAHIWLVKRVRELIRKQHQDESDATPQPTRTDASSTDVAERTKVSLSEDGPGEAIQPVLYVDDEPALVIGDTMTVEELLTDVTELMQENDGSTTLHREWTIQMN